MHSQENTFLTAELDLGVKVTENVVQYPIHHVTYSGTTFEVSTSNNLGGDAFTRRQYLTFDLVVKVTRNVARYPVHRVTYSGTKFEVATSNSLGGDAFTRKYIILALNLTLGSRSYEMLPRTLYIM